MKNISFLALALWLSTVCTYAADTIYDISLKDIDGKDTTLAPYKGQVILIVNVASKCGNTPQYAALEQAYTNYQAQGLVVCGFPCNQFHAQEPGTDADIKLFCTSKYDVTFPMFDKLDVNGDNRHPLYTFLAGSSSPFPGDIQWNFAKFLIGRDGKIVNRFSPKTKPDAPEVTAAIQAALAAKQ